MRVDLELRQRDPHRHQLASGVRTYPRIRFRRGWSSTDALLRALVERADLVEKAVVALIKGTANMGLAA